MEIGIAGPTGRAEFTRAGDGPQTPLQASGGGIVGRDKAAHAGVAAGRAYDDGIFDDERRAGGAIGFGLVGVFNIPAQAAGAGVEREQVGVVGFHVDRILPDSDAAVFVGSGIVEQARTVGALMMPQDAASPRIEREGVVGGSDVHNAAHDDRRDFEALRVSGMENPRSLHFYDVSDIDFLQTAEAAAGVVAVVGRPVCADGLSQQIVVADFRVGRERRLALLLRGWKCGQGAGRSHQSAHRCRGPFHSQHSQRLSPELTRTS